MTIACMGGWCSLREHCSHYHAASKATPAERLCATGRDGKSDDAVIHISRPAGTWERSNARALLAPAQPFDALTA